MIFAVRFGFGLFALIFMGVMLFSLSFSASTMYKQELEKVAAMCEKTGGHMGSNTWNEVPTCTDDNRFYNPYTLKTIEEPTR